MMKSKKGLSLVEVMVVVTIISIIAIIFLAMPKKKVSKMDKAKYYAAYTMLKSMQDARLAKDGSAPLNNFCSTVHTWLNVTNASENCTCSVDGGNKSNCVNLINGMNLFWTDDNDASTVTIDLDGLGNGLNKDTKDQHNFTLYSTPSDSLPLLVEPDRSTDAAGGMADWIEFRVYSLDDGSGRKSYNTEGTDGTSRAAYNTIMKNKIYYNCNNSHNNNCFIEAKKPY